MQANLRAFLWQDTRKLSPSCIPVISHSLVLALIGIALVIKRIDKVIAVFLISLGDRR
jgi:hypothetical protein